MNLVDAYVTKVLKVEIKHVDWSIEPKVVFHVEYESHGSISKTQLWFGYFGDIPIVEKGYKFQC